MSLILEALKKLEREKAAGERGLVVLSHLPWVGARSAQGSIVRGALGILAALGLGLGAWSVWRARPAEVAPPPAAGRATDASPAPLAIPEPAPPTSQPRDVTLPRRPVHPPELMIEPAAPVPVATPADANAAAPATPPKPAGLVLNAISVQDGHPVAILNDRLVREGDSFDGIRILHIGDAEVEVEVDGERRTLRF